MKTLYYLNIIIIFTNLLLGITVVFGLLFMMVTGVFQVICYIIYMTQWKKISSTLKTPFIIYGILTTVTLIPFFNVDNVGNLGDDAMPILFFSGILAFYFLFLSKKQYDFSKKNLEISETIN